MRKYVYKSDEGRKEVEDTYRKILHEHLFLGFEQFFIETEAGQTHVIKFGNKSKPPLIMIHGTASNSASWFGNVLDFSDVFCVYCVDIPGEVGLSEPYRHSLTSEMPHKWISSLLDKLNIKIASFVTISLGSWYALNFAIQSPGRVKILSMITTPGIVPAKRSFILKAIVFMMLGKMGQKLINKMLYYKTIVPSEVLEFQSIVSKHFVPLMEVIPLFSDEQLKNITIPVQFFGGDHDALIDSMRTGERLKKLVFNVDVNILEETGHVIIDQFPAIKEFLLKN